MGASLSKFELFIDLIIDPSQLPNLCPRPKRDFPAEMVSSIGWVSAIISSFFFSWERSSEIFFLAGSSSYLDFFDGFISSAIIAVVYSRDNLDNNYPDSLNIYSYLSGMEGYTP